MTAIVLVAAVLASSCEEAESRALAQHGPRSGFAVVELFTSQGCSSCPPADAFLRELDRAARRADQPVYVLSFHVDYWNRLGWKDPFSDGAYSERQRRYAQTLPSRVYTPQLVVNGREDVVGSREREARALVAQALRRRPQATVDASLADCDGRAKVRHRVSGAPADAELLLAVVERGLSSKVTRGENAGRRLRHTNVVRALRARETDERETKLSLSPVGDARHSSVIAFVQDPGTGHVLGADAVTLGPCVDNP